VEYPVPVLCSFAEEYLTLPKELLVTVMKDHQKYFAVQDSKGNLQNRFVVISNTRAENAEMVRTGAQRVIKARFDDAKFYYSEDTSEPLASMVDSLRDVTFHDKLGSMLDKTRRIEATASFIAEKVAPGIKEAVVRAAYLSKADLITGVVREFPELQGIMGRYYAFNDRETEEVSEALREQYMPKSFGDDIPATDHGAILSISDRVDNLASFFSIGQIPTGSEDPFALRRQAMGVISILLAKGYDISLKEIFEGSMNSLGTDVSRDELTANIMNFMAQRTEFILSSAGHDLEIIKSVLQHSFMEPLQSIASRMDALSSIRKDQKFLDYIIAVKRVNNIVPKTELPEVLVSLFRQDEERNLHSSLMECKPPFTSALKEGNFPVALERLMTLTPFINGFFDKVLVMDKDADVKNNRLSLLKEIWETVSLIADFSKFQS
jgi:glycyl-tRNA synthetase beta chain